ncbi:hypothetical protein N7466_004761 [Penicillium verhagenii]|uniref:uncharacterized protein n=1 Tax=Penicillium verhagenii TaxID=1562060 RepID=UPI0025450B08|nr:uncharacterized protein N7466_004761 [Penicillium verhagenii]KAJ5935214.1 hypothetical protein N7466_004761 [Penicillium verhagenii]
MGQDDDSVSNDAQQQTNAIETGEQIAESESESNSSGALGDVKTRLNNMTGGSSISEISSRATAVAGEKVVALKDTVMENAVPAAGEALQSLGGRIRNLAGEVEETVEEDLDMEKHSEHIDKMDKERLCDFLRDKHKSTAPSLPTN